MRPHLGKRYYKVFYGTHWDTFPGNGSALRPESRLASILAEALTPRDSAMPSTSMLRHHQPISLVKCEGDGGADSAFYFIKLASLRILEDCSSFDNAQCNMLPK